QQSGDLLLRNFQRSADAVTRNAGELGLVDECGRRLPQLEVIIHVEHLQERDADQVASPAQDAGRLRATNRLAAAVDDEVGPGRDDRFQIRAWRQLPRGID